MKRKQVLAILMAMATIPAGQLPVCAEEMTDAEMEAMMEENKKLKKYVGTDGFAESDSCVNLRESPDTEGKVIGALFNDAIVHIEDVDEFGWYKVTSGDMEGYVSSEFILIGEEAEKKKETAGYKVATVGAEELNVREDADANAPVIMSVQENQKLGVMEDYGEWILVAVDDYSSGFVHSDYVDVTKEYLTAVPAEIEMHQQWVEQPAAPEEVEYIPETSAPETEYVPETSVPETEYVPETSAPETEYMPETSAPETEYVPETSAPETEYVPETSAPETEYVPETSAPETEYVPETSAPETEYVPETSAPETEYVPETSTPETSAPETEYVPETSAPETEYTEETTGSDDTAEEIWNDDEVYYDADTDQYYDIETGEPVPAESYEGQEETYEEVYVDETYEEGAETYIEETEAPQTEVYVEETEAPQTEVYVEETEAPAAASSLGQEIASYACQFVGNPYVWGGTSLTNGADCSGFVQSVFANYGVYLPRTAADQSGAGYSVDVGSIQAGDLLFYSHGGGIDHVALYIGGGQIVHASTAATGIKISNAFYSTPVCARRVV